MGAVMAPGFTDWDDIAVRSSKAQPIPGVARGDLPALAGRPLRPPTRALGWFDDRFQFCVPGQPDSETALSGLSAAWVGWPATTRGRVGPVAPPRPVVPVVRKPVRRWGMGSFEETTFWTPLAPADPNVVDARVLAPEAACPATPIVEDEGLSGLGCGGGYNRYGVSGLGQLPFGLDSQSVMWIAIIGGAAIVLPMLFKSKKAKAAALRKARYKYRAEESAIQARYA